MFYKILFLTQAKVQDKKERGFLHVTHSILLGYNSKPECNIKYQKAYIYVPRHLLDVENQIFFCLNSYKQGT